MVHSQEKEAYLYSNYGTIFNTAGAKLSILPSAYQTLFYSNPLPYSPSEARAYAFMQGAHTASESSNIDDLFKQKVITSKDNIELLLSQIRDRDKIKYHNLKRIYDDLLRVDQFRSQIPYPQNYERNKTWTDLNNSELRLREQIRRELQTANHDLSFLHNDLRRGLLEYKSQTQKQNMMNIDLGGSLDEIIGPDSSVLTIQGETYEQKPN